MWALRRASTPLKSQAISNVTFRASCAKTEAARCYFEDIGGFVEPPPDDRKPSLKRLYNSACNTPQSFIGIHSFSSRAGMKSSGEEDDDLEDGFSELETPVDANARGNNLEDESDNELISGDEDDDDAEKEPQNELELSEVDEAEKISRGNRVSSGLFNAIMDGSSIHNSLEKWVEEGNELTSVEISTTMQRLRKRGIFGKALEFSEWLESSKKIEFVDRDYASRLDLIAKNRGLQKAEGYIHKIPESFRGELVYRTLLANCVRANNPRKAEEVFKKMKDLKFTITPFACNQLLLLYKRIDKKKIADILLFMEKENVKPSPFTYQLLIDTKGQSNDIAGMEQIVETMKAEGIELDTYVQAILARHYVSGGLKEKAEAVLKEMEGSNLEENRWVCKSLLPLYASLGDAEEVARIWKVCEPNPRTDECIAAIEAWGKLKEVEEAEAVFARMTKMCKRISSRHYSAMLKVYANHKMLAEGKELVKQMGESGCRIGPLTWDALVKLYVEAGEVEKADSILLKAAQQSPVKPMFQTYMTIMDQYSKRGDIHNAEKIFYKMRQVGYLSRLRLFQSLLQTYVKAKAPAYGFRERMKADDVFPNKGMAALLSQVDAFKRNAVSDLLE